MVVEFQSARRSCASWRAFLCPGSVWHYPEARLTQSLFDRSSRLQGGIPPRLQLGRYQTIVWMDSFISTSCQAYFVLRSFQFQREHTTALSLLFANACGNLQSCFDGVAFHCLQDLSGNARSGRKPPKEIHQSPP